MYNLEVAGNHDFFVGENAWLVHNAGFDACDLSIHSANNARKSIVGGIDNVRVKTKQEAVDIYNELFAGRGYTNTSGYTGNEVRKMLPRGKEGTYHWDFGDTEHGGMAHIQMHTFDGRVIRIFFTEGGGNPIKTPPR
jgi:hypothetical protein